MLDEELPRNHQSITNRNELRAVLHLDSLYKENKGSEKPLKTLLEIIAKYFLQHFGKAEHCNVIEEQNPAAEQQLIKRLHLKGLDNSVLNVCDISDDEAGGSSAVSDTCTTQIYRSELNTSFYKIDQSKGSHHKSKKAEGNTKSSRSSAEGERKNVTENRDRFRMSEPTCEVKNATQETQRPKSSRIVRGMMSGPIASSQEDSSKKRTQKRSAGINNIIQIKEEAQTNNILGGTNGASSNYAGSAALQLGKEFSAKGLSAPVSAPATENVRSASLNTTIPVSKEKLEGETNGETQTEESRMSITTNDKNFTFKFPPGVGQERRPRSKKSDNHPPLNRKTLVSISHEEQNHQEDIKLDDVEEELATGEMSMIPAFLPRSKVQVEGKPIDLFQAVEIKKLLFGSSLCCFSDEWKIQSFTFNNRPLLKYGFVQKKGGPCGVLAAVQGCVLQNLLFGKDTDSRVLQPSETQRTRCLCNAIADILWRAGDRERAVVALSSGRQQFSPAGRYKADGILETLILYKLGKYEDLMSFLQQNINQFEFGPYGCILLTLSVVFSRSVELVQKDFDVPTNCLIGAHAYCTQELVNLILTGRSVSNTFNDVLELDSGNGNITLLRGITQRSDTGFLSLFEHYSVCQVGSYLKTPKYPIWVICSESHFSVLFCVRKELMSDWKIERRFDLYYYDGLANQQEEIRLTIDTTGSNVEDEDNDLIPPLEYCIRTKWKGAFVDWNGTEPIL
ncbi:putative ubiquitin carboxyl-terminal hydrolase MINDY-4 isoform X2 [Ascaphus truei]